VFEALVQEQETLERLYRPLRDRISEEARLGKLSFTVGRVVDLPAWATRGETLFDLRTPPFQGHGKILEAARSVLLEPWWTGDPATVVEAMEAFWASISRRRSSSPKGRHWPTSESGSSRRV